MRIVKPGYMHDDDEREFTCPRCACEFLADRSDFVKPNGTKVKDDDDNCDICTVRCPWCEEKLHVIL